MSETRKKNPQTQETIRSLVPTIARTATVLGTLIAALLGINAYVDGRVRKQLADHETLRSIARQLRPTLIFDSRGRIMADLGALDYIETVKVVPGDGSLPTKIIIRPKEFMAAPPFLEAINDPGLVFQAERAQGIAWSFNLEQQGVFTSSTDETRFRLEILH